MAEVGPAVAAGEAWTGFFERAVVALVDVVAEAEGAGIGEGHRVAAVASGQDAIEQVDAAADGVEQILRRADTHEVPRLFGGHRRTNDVENSVHFFGRFAAAQSADGVAGEIELGQLPSAPDAELGIEAALNYCESGLVAARRGCLAPRGPADGAITGVANCVV